MTSNTRRDCGEAVKKFSKSMNLEGGNRILYVGIAGDPIGGEYSSLFSCRPTTFDADAKWNPQIVGDITKTGFLPNSWDHIVIVQVIEHIPNIFDLPTEIHRIVRRNGLIIIDCPWNYPYHAEPPSFGDYWRISKDGFTQLFKDPFFKVEDCIMTENNTSCLIRRL